MPTCNRIYATTQRGLSFEDMKREFPIANKDNGVLGENNDIVKLTLIKNIYEQNILSEVFYDESEGTYVFSDQYDKDLSEVFADKFISLHSNLDNIMELNPGFTFEHIGLVLGAEMTEYMINGSKETH